MGLCFIGDLMLGRHVRTALDEFGLSALLSSPTALAGSRYLIANLECPLTDDAVSQPIAGPPRLAGPAFLAQELFELGFRAVSIGNNHIMDAGADGLIDTIRTLDDAGIQWSGAGLDAESARAPIILDVDGLAVGILGFSYRPIATEQSPGVANLYSMDAVESVKRWRKDVDYLVVMPHAGVEMMAFPMPRDRSIYHSLVKAGADLVIGGHPHCVQVRERVDSAWIYYSLGDALFDHHVPSVQSAFSRAGTNASELVPMVHGSLDLARSSYCMAVFVDFADGAATVSHCPLRRRTGPGVTQMRAEESRSWEVVFDEACTALVSDQDLQARLARAESELFRRLGGDR